METTKLINRFDSKNSSCPNSFSNTIRQANLSKRNCKHTELVEIDTKIPCSDGYGVLGIPGVRKNPENRVFASDISPLSMNPDLLIKPSFSAVTVPISSARTYGYE